MTEPLASYARVGLVHHMLHPACLDDPDDHERTLTALARRPDIETLDCCLPYGAERRARLHRVLGGCGKAHLCYAPFLYPARKLPFTATNSSEQAQIRLLLADQVEQAAAIGATGFITVSGGPPPDQATPAHHAAYADFLGWLCDELRPLGIDALIEPFDTNIDKCYLYGPSADCAALVARLGRDNLGIELDLAHVPLMGETPAQAIRNVAPILRRVHLGNSVLDRGDPRYGDTHPPIGYAGGLIDVPELAEGLALLLDVGYLNTVERGDLVLEITTYPDRSVEETIADNLDRLAQAWALVGAA
jgi:sugar phosphate isomerase/epimerase